MILVVLFVMVAGLALISLGLWWLLSSFPKVAAMLKMSRVALLALCSLIVLLAFSTFAGWRIVCPFCHAGQVDDQGRCNFGRQCSNFYSHPQWDQMSEKERSMWTGEPGHYKAESCPWCGHTGKLSRIAIWLD